MWGGRIRRSAVTQIIHKDLRLKTQVLQEKALSTADWSAQHASVIFGRQFESFGIFLRRDNKQTYMKTETCKLTLFWSLLKFSAKYHQNRSIQFWAIPLQSWCIFLRHSVYNLNVQIYLRSERTSYASAICLNRLSASCLLSRFLSGCQRNANFR